ncbi:hypothetical protein M011DRAFT_458597 [Sporormia fimetaria CBS 119925]|uniref:Uncharacterized protein n=1 Tax=Sporormia fimetaria CBS 119925 TaxID=1340428 RepID=A0A6A6VC77_9PLEO|nr:hypothetical protein M011DRAFT_458597 [Sporormia fimetaria CBS 119925]
MDPASNTALHNAKIFFPLQPETVPEQPPPSYYSTFSPGAPMSDCRNPYDADDEEKDDHDELPEVTINATTQIRGHGNVISVPPLDAVRVAGLIHNMLYGPPGQAAPSTFRCAGPPNRRAIPKLNITVNCGATIFGDRNVVGPALSDIARQVQMARHQQLAQAQNHALRPKTTQPVQAIPQSMPILTPIRSRGSSESDDSEASKGSKRKAECDGDVSPEVKRQAL